MQKTDLTKPCPDCRRVLTNEPKCFYCAERDQLRAELAAAKNLLARIHRDGGHHTEAVGFAKSVADAGNKVSEWLLAAEERDALAAHVERMEGVLKVVKGKAVALSTLSRSAGNSMALELLTEEGNKRDELCGLIEAAIAATPAQSPETNSEQDFWARMQGPLVHCPNTASTSAGSSAAIELHAKQLREALETLNHAAKVAISSLYGSSFDEDTPLVIRLLDGTCDATDAVLAATPAQSLDAHDAWAVLEIGGEMDRNEVLERLLWMERWYESETNKGVHAPFATALRAAAELIRQGGWRPIAEVDAGEVIYAGKWNDRDEWQECWPIVADVAVSFGYTHHWPQMKKPEPPARKDSKAKNGEENDRQT